MFKVQKYYLKDYEVIWEDILFHEYFGFEGAKKYIQGIDHYCRHMYRIVKNSQVIFGYDS